MTKKKIITYVSVFSTLIALNVFCAYFFTRLDLTSEKRYSISDNTKKLLKNLDRDVRILVYLDGDLNPGFLRLKRATGELMDEFKVYAGSDFTYQFINPSAAASKEEREKNYITLYERGIQPTELFDSDEEGKAIRKLVFPWAEIICGKDTISVNLLKNNRRISGEQNLNNSIESLEFELTDAIRIQTMKKRDKVAFIEGHGEFPDDFVYEATNAFFRYFDVYSDRLSNHADELSDFKAIVIAGSQAPFSEQEKFIIDQYIMNGGRVMWLVDGVRISRDSLSSVGFSPAFPLDLNLEDQLFKYGVRIAPVLLQDMQSVQIPMNVAQPNEPAKFQPMPWYYSPLLLSAPPAHPIVRNLVEVKADFASALDLSVSQNPNIRKIPLLITSNATHAEMTPTYINLNTMYNMDSRTHFNRAYIPVAAAFEGRFPSVFTNRLVPQGIITNKKIITESKPTRMVVVADADIIRNDVQLSGTDTLHLPMGFDRYSKRIYGNRSFILNAMLYLADDDGWLQLRSREFKLRLLNKKEVISRKKQWQAINVGLPLVVLGLFAGGYLADRRRKYA